MKNYLLLAASLLFYAYGEPVYVCLLVLSAFVNYLFGLLLERRKTRWILAGAVLVNLAVLIFFKYAGFLVDTVNHVLHMSFPVLDIRLPIGISFFTFQAMSYVIDVYRAQTAAQKNFSRLLLYISFFPQLIAGPIVKYHEMDEALSSRRQTVEDVAAGLRRFTAGLAKKVLIANTLGAAADLLFSSDFSEVNIMVAWIGAISYMMQIYFDFSGYSDMAIGMGRMFGFRFRENFNYPYISGSVREFWRRWHISLSSWFREYLYIPLGGNRKGEKRAMVNRLIVFLCTGIWHGANVTFLFWGIYHGFFLTLETLAGQHRRVHMGSKKAVTVLKHGYTLLVVCVGFVFFRAETLSKGFAWVGEMFFGFHFERAAVSLAIQQLTPLFCFTLAAAILTALPQRRYLERLRCYEPVSYIASAAALVLCIWNLAGNTYNPFIYFQF